MINSLKKKKGYSKDGHRVNFNIIGNILFLKPDGGYFDNYIIVLHWGSANYSPCVKTDQQDTYVQWGAAKNMDFIY